MLRLARRFARTAIVLTLFLVVFGIFGLAIYGSSSYQKCSAEASNESGTDYQGQEKDLSRTFVRLLKLGQIVFRCAEQSIAENNAVVSAVATVVIAVFTTILGLFTMSLAGSTRIAADAAKESADATAALERQYLFPSEATLVQQNGPNDPSPHITYSVTNLGRVPGVIRMIYAEAILRGTDRVPIATYRKGKFMDAQITLGGGYNTVPDSLLPVSFDESISEQDYIDARDGKKLILFKVLLIYSGLDFTYYSAVAYRIDINTGVNYPVGGHAYNYEKTEKGAPNGNQGISPRNSHCPIVSRGLSQSPKIPA